MINEDVVEKIGKIIKRNSPTFTIISFIMLVLSIVLLVILVIPVYSNSRESGQKIGETTGELVGTALGSAKGVIDAPQALKDGKEEGLRAEDVTVTISESFKETGNLEVLVCNTQVEDIVDENTYKAIYIRPVDIIYTVNLSSADIIYNINNDTFTIKINKPKPEFVLDPTKAKKIAEWESPFNIKSSRDGFISILNSINNTTTEIKKKINNYENLEENANRSAKEQVKSLVGSITQKNVEVVFKD